MVRETRALAELVQGVTGARLDGVEPGIRVRGIETRVESVRSGDLFVAIRGPSADGHAFVESAAAAGAAAAVVEREIHVDGMPVLVVPNSRKALAELAATWNRRPADRLQLAGITGSHGKTTILTMLEAILAEAGIIAGTIGSLGIRIGERSAPTELTTPDARTLHHTLKRMLAEGAAVAAMEVTSHALDQDRVHGLVFALGVFTNLSPLEHLDYHGDFRSYAAAKSRFLGQMAPGAPVVYRAGDRAVRTLIDRHDVTPLSCGPFGVVSIRTDRLLLDRGGSRITLRVRRPLSRPGGVPLAPVTIPVELQVLGRPNISNASLAATAALCLGAETDAVIDALADHPAPWRRMQIVHRGRFTVLDDTVGHPDSISAVFEVAEKIRHHRLHVVYAVRGRRGSEINRRDAEALAIWSRRVPIHTLIVTSSEDVADERNRVERGEREAFVTMLRRYDKPHRHARDLRGAIDMVLDQCGRRDLVLLLGAQGMDRGAEFLLEAIGA